MRATREEQRREAVRRLEIWRADEYIIKIFNEGKLALCEWIGSPNAERSIMLVSELPKNILAKVREVEETYGLLVYTAIESDTEIGVLYDLLYVCEDKKDWEIDALLMEDNVAMSYCINDTEPAFSEFGTIGIANWNGGLYRIY